MLKHDQYRHDKSHPRVVLLQPVALALQRLAQRRSLVQVRVQLHHLPQQRVVLRGRAVRHGTSGGGGGGGGDASARLHFRSLSTVTQYGTARFNVGFILRRFSS